MKKAIYAGSFDPITKGHEWVIQEASLLFDEVVVVLASNSNKKSYFNNDLKRKFILDAISKYSNVKFDEVIDEYIVAYAERNQIKYLIRGIRNSQDLEYESTVERINQKINPKIQTVYLRPPTELAEISSSLVKNLVGYIGWQVQVEKFVSKQVMEGFLSEQYISKINKFWFDLAGDSDYSRLWLSKIVQSHSQSNRYYHNLQHISELIDVYLKAKKELSMDSLSWQSIAYSIFFHDYIYDSKSNENEEKSIEIWMEYATGLNLFDLTVNTVKEIILATKNHNKPSQYVPICLFLDMDLAILGSNEKRYKEYEDCIRLEYSWVSDMDYTKSRNEFMMKFKNPYKTDWANNLFYENFKKNIAKYEKLQ